MKKTVLPAIILWVLYALTAGCFLFLTAMNLSAGTGHNPETGLIAGTFALVLAGALTFAVARFKEFKLHSTGKYGRHKKHRNYYLIKVAAESALAVCLLVLMMLLRIRTPVNTSPWNVLSSSDYTLAQVNVNAHLPTIAHKGRELYLHLLHGGFFLLGNTPETVKVVQLILLGLAAVSLYFGVHKNAGGTTAVSVLAFLGITPYMLGETCRISSFLLVMIFYGLALRCISGITDLKQDNKAAAVLYYLLTGFLIGFCCYLEMTGITLLIFLTGELCFGKEDGLGKEDADNESGPLTAFLCCLFSAIFGYVMCHGIRALAGGTISSSINAQLRLYLPDKFVLPMMRNAGAGSWDIVVMAVLMALGIYSFWLCRKIRTKGIWFFAAVLLFLMQGFGMESRENFNSFALLYLFGAAMAGISIEDLRVSLHTSRSASARVITGGEGFELQQIENPEEIKMEILDQKENGNDENTHERDMKFQYIENPLPVPKKHEHKVMDYDYEVAEDDDFDIP